MRLMYVATVSLLLLFVTSQSAFGATVPETTGCRTRRETEDVPSLDSNPSPDQKDVLQLKCADLLLERNKEAHNTDKYADNYLIVRRAANFNLDLFFNRAYDPSRDHVYLEFAIGENADVASDTKIHCLLTDQHLDDNSKWSCKSASRDDDVNRIGVDVNIPRGAIIGRYKLTIEISSELENEDMMEREILFNDFIVLFNPFSADDSCYMEDETERAEYVTEDSGLMYVGTFEKIRSETWTFGQHEEGVLDAVLLMFEKDSRMQKNPQEARNKMSSPVYCSRVLSAMTNAINVAGVLEPNWSGYYSGSKPPGSWSSSVPILKQWMQTRSPVRYGQSGEFAGLLTTALRAIGIPARPVTNFRSAHDTDGNLKVDEFHGGIGVTTAEVPVSVDSIWIFHIWSEAWFARPDLSSGYDGWQVVDGTPQELSDGLFQLGPAPVKAIKNGDVHIGQDTVFFFSAVNADKVDWLVEIDCTMFRLWSDTEYVGKSISTKSVGLQERKDLTDRYKFPEGSKEERSIYKRAQHNIRNITTGIGTVGDSTDGKNEC